MALLDGKTTVVTGGSSGIGRGVALQFAREGANVVAADVREDPKEGGLPTHERLIFKTYETNTGPQQTVMPTYTYDVFFRNDEIDDDDAITYEANYI